MVKVSCSLTKNIGFESWHRKNLKWKKYCPWSYQCKLLHKIVHPPKVLWTSRSRTKRKQCWWRQNKDSPTRDQWKPPQDNLKSQVSEVTLLNQSEINLLECIIFSFYRMLECQSLIGSSVARFVKFLQLSVLLHYRDAVQSP